MNAEIISRLEASFGGKKPDPFSVEEIEAEFERLLGRALRRVAEPEAVTSPKPTRRK